MSDAAVGRPGGFLAALDTRNVGSFYIYLAILATIGGFLFGFDPPTSGRRPPFLPFNLGAIGIGIVVSGASLGAVVGALCAGPITDRFGRKSLLIIDSGIFALGALLSAARPELGGARHRPPDHRARDRGRPAIATAYIAEFAPKSRRGSLSIIQQWMITVGILVAYIVAVIILKVAPATPHRRRLAPPARARLVPAVISLLLRARMPESPRWLLLQGRNQDVRHALGKLGMEVTDQQVAEEAEALRAAGSPPTAGPHAGRRPYAGL